MKIRIDEVVPMMTFIDGSVYLDIANQEHLDDFIQHLEEMWEIVNKDEE